MAHSFGHQSSGKGVGVVIGLAALAVGVASLAQIFGYYEFSFADQLSLFSAIGSAVAGIVLIFSSLKSSHY